MGSIPHVQLSSRKIRAAFCRAFVSFKGAMARSTANVAVLFDSIGRDLAPRARVSQLTEEMQHQQQHPGRCHGQQVSGSFSEEVLQLLLQASWQKPCSMQVRNGIPLPTEARDIENPATAGSYFAN
jgi:hypothetical protein